MRMLGYRAVDEIVRHLTTLRDRPVGGPSDRRELERLFTAPAPENPTPAPEVLDEVVDQVLTAIVHTDHPRFMATFPGLVTTSARSRTFSRPVSMCSPVTGWSAPGRPSSNG